MQKICPECKAVIAEEDAGAFCPECGCELASAAPEAAPAVVPASGEALPPPPVVECNFEKKFATPQGVHTISGNLTEVGQKMAEEIDRMLPRVSAAIARHWRSLITGICFSFAVQNQS